MVLLFISLSILTSILSAIVESISVMMFISSLTIEVSKILGFNPVPFKLTEIVSSNIGGSATMVGDPPNVIIGTSLGLILLVFHKSINISVGVIGLIGASLALFLNGNKFRNIWEKIDWDTLLFFIGLFIIVDSLEKVGFYLKFQI